MLSYLVKPDFFAHLGDVATGHAATTPEMLKTQIEEFIAYFREARSDLPVFICIGNHDKKLLRNKEVRDLFVEIVDYKEIQISKDCGIVLSHYPIPCFNNHYYGWYHLYGHVHKSFEWNMMENVKFQMSALYDKECRMYNVGIMIPYMEFMPKTLEEIVEAEKVYSALRGIVNV